MPDYLTDTMTTFFCLPQCIRHVVWSRARFYSARDVVSQLFHRRSDIVTKAADPYYVWSSVCIKLAEDKVLFVRESCPHLWRRTGCMTWVPSRITAEEGLTRHYTCIDIHTYDYVFVMLDVSIINDEDEDVELVYSCRRIETFDREGDEKVFRACGHLSREECCHMHATEQEMWTLKGDVGPN